MIPDYIRYGGDRYDFEMERMEQKWESAARLSGYNDIMDDIDQKKSYWVDQIKDYINKNQDESMSEDDLLDEFFFNEEGQFCQDIIGVCTKLEESGFYDDFYQIISLEAKKAYKELNSPKLKESKTYQKYKNRFLKESVEEELCPHCGSLITPKNELVRIPDGEGCLSCITKCSICDSTVFDDECDSSGVCINCQAQALEDNFSRA